MLQEKIDRAMREGLFITHSGKLINPADFKKQDVDIKDIARALATKVRYNGQTSRLITVAEHSLNLSKLVHPDYALEALLHDAAEAYVGDIPAPFKRLIPDYSILEDHVDIAIRMRFGLPLRMSHHVKQWDIKIRIGELEAVAERMELDPEADYHRFLERFNELYKEK